MPRHPYVDVQPSIKVDLAKWMTYAGERSVDNEKKMTNLMTRFPECKTVQAILDSQRGHAGRAAGILQTEQRKRPPSTVSALHNNPVFKLKGPGGGGGTA